jgi:16S rRNA (guanine1207-N2)-methyltransferase
MIEAAARALKSGGRLLLVANRQLPYEQVLARAFRDGGETARDGRYKVLWAVR